MLLARPPQLQVPLDLKCRLQTVVGREAVGGVRQVRKVNRKVSGGSEFDGDVGEEVFVCFVWISSPRDAN